MLTIDSYNQYEQNIRNILDSGVNATTGEPIPASFEAEMDIEPFEHFAFQERQARAHAAGTISADVARVIYAALGETQASGNGGWQPHVDLARKVTITRLIGELAGV